MHVKNVFPADVSEFRFSLLFYIAFNSQGHIAMGSLQAEETSACCTVNLRALARNYQLSNMKHRARDSNQQPQRLEARTLIATPLSPTADVSEGNRLKLQIKMYF